MYNFKVYDRTWKFIQTLRENEISCEYSFSASLNGGYTSLRFDYYGDFGLDHKQRIKIYKGEQCVYQWFIIWLTKKADKSGKRLSINCSWLLGLLSFVSITPRMITANPSSVLRDIFSFIPWTDPSWIQEYPESISFESKATNLLSLLQELLAKVSDFSLFLNADNKVSFKPYDNLHILTYNSECFNIELAEDSSAYFNYIKLNFDGWSYVWEDSDWILQYGLNELDVNDSSIKNQITAKGRVENLLKEKWIKRNYKVSVNSNYNYYTIKPWDFLSVRNTEWIIENKEIKQITYSKNTAVISLESYEPIENFIINQK